MQATLKSERPGAHFLVVLASLIIVIAGLKSAAPFLVPLCTAIFLALINLPLLNFLRKNRIPTPIAVLITVITSLSVLALIVWLITGSVAQFSSRVPVYQQKLTGMYNDVLAWLSIHGLAVDPVSTDLLDPAAIFDVATATLGRAAAAVSNVALVMITIVFILFEAAGFPDKLQAAFGRRSTSDRYERIRHEIQRYLAIKTLISLFTGLFVAIPLWAMRVDFALLWGLIAFLLNYIPNIGSFIASIPPVLLTLVERGVGWAIAVAIVFIVVNTTFGNFIEPYLMGRRLGMSTLVVFLSLVFWGWVWGPVGMLLSVPLTMILKIMLENTEDLRWIAVLLSGQPPPEVLARPVQHSARVAPPRGRSGFDPTVEPD